jgi:predicted nucleic acid-binding protein
MEAGRVMVCLPFLLEAGYSARSGADHRALMDDLERLPRIGITSQIEGLALRAQAELARIGHHRLAPLDVIIAACAHANGMGVLHYDRDYDTLAERTSLSFTSEWLVSPGTL